jgi:hypothetical protein
METAVAFILLVVLVLGIRLAAGSLDHERVRAHFESQGAKLLSARWEPFGRGWFGEKGDRIYRVRWRDADGDVHEAQCKTSLFSGVYFADQRRISTGERAPADARDLRAENARLRAEIEDLKRRAR